MVIRYTHCLHVAFDSTIVFGAWASKLKNVKIASNHVKCPLQVPSKLMTESISNGVTWNESNTNNWNYTIRYNKLAQTLSLFLPYLFSTLLWSIYVISYVSLCFHICFAAKNKRQATEVHWISNELKLYPFCTLPLRILHWGCHCYLCSVSIASFDEKQAKPKECTGNFLQCDLLTFNVKKTNHFKNIWNALFIKFGSVQEIIDTGSFLFKNALFKKSMGSTVKRSDVEIQMGFFGNVSPSSIELFAVQSYFIPKTRIRYAQYKRYSK